jgi:DNA (cytosine-5)-methyltransferase 1
MPLETGTRSRGSAAHVHVPAEKSSIWSPQVPSEENAYAHQGAPQILQSAREDALAHGPRVIDLFSGAGGASVGLAAAGFSVIAGVDHHRPSADTFTHNHPDTGYILGDIRDIEPSSVARVARSEEIEMLVAGIPCQGFSRSNRKRNDADRRNYLFREFLRFAESFLPPVVLVENVSGIRAAANGAFVIAIREELENLGYDVDVRVLNAADFGVPQVRQRLFFLGIRDGQGHAWPEPTHGPSARQPHLTVADAIADLPPLQAGESATRYSSPPATKYQREMRGTRRVLLNHTAPAHPKAVQEKIGQTRPGTPIYPRFRQRIRLSWDRPSPTQLAGGIRPQYQFGHPDQPRGLSIRERCRIQSFPDAYEIRGGIVQGRVQTGNAIPPRLVQAIGRKILKHVFASDPRC